MNQPAYAMTKDLPETGFDDAVTRITAALAEEGFGILTEINIQATLKKKLGVDFPRYTILGACNPKLAHQALQEEPLIGLLLPCNVVVTENGNGVTVAIATPTSMFSVVGRDDLGSLANDAEAKLAKALEHL